MLLRNRKGIQSEKYIKKRRKRGVIVVILFLVATGSVILALVLLSKANFLQIENIQISGTNLVPVDSVRKITEADLAGTRWGLFSKNSLVLYPADMVRNDLLKAFLPIADVSFGHGDLHTLYVLIKERTPFAVTCASSDDLTCWYLDQSGFIYAPAPQFSPGVYVLYATDATSSQSSPNLGQYITDPSRFAIARRAVDYFSSLGLTVVGATVPSGGDDDGYQVSLKDEASTTIAIYFNTSQPLEKTFEYFGAFWQHQTDKDFQYIDLRYGKDIVFKME